MTKIKIFESDKEIDLPVLIDSRMLVMANSGAGKSYLVRKILEESHGKVMSIILDFEGEFKSLREKYDYLLIGNDGDVEINLKSAHLLPKKLLELNIPTIVDISDFKRHERIAYVKKFLEALMEVPRDLWKPCLVVLDEIHNLCGQQEKQESSYAVIDVATRGRKRGFSLIGVTQRISKLHKDVCAELNNYAVGRTSLDIDMKRSADILGFSTKQDMLSLRELDDGEFYVFGPAISKKIEKEKVGKSKTTHPKQGMDIKKQIIPPTEKVKGIISKLNDLPKEQEKEMKTVQDYKNKISELTRELTITKKGNAPQQAKVDYQAIEKVKEKSKQEGFKEAEKQFYPERARYKKDINSLKDFIQQITIKGSKLLQIEIPKIEVKPMVIPKVEPIKNIQKVSEKQPISYESDTNRNFGICAKKIYSFLYHNSDRTFTKAQVGAVTGYSHKSGGFNNALSELGTAGLIDRIGGNLKVRELDSSIAGDFDFSKEAIISKLSKCESEIYNILLENPNTEYSKEELANETPTQYSHGSGGFNNALSKLNTLGLIQRNGGTIKLNPDLLEI
jgi:hypothetical protein